MPTTDQAPATGVVYSPEYKKHLTGFGHPESPKRVEAVMTALQAAGLENQLLKIEPRPATEDELLACHTREYLQIVKRDVAALSPTLSTGDTNISERSLEIALLAAGGVLQAVDAVIEAKVRNAFCIVRPPGHHATPDVGMGFCLFNNIAVAARYAQRKHKIGKVLIADCTFDVPVRSSVCRIWRWRLERSITSMSTMPIFPMPAAAR
jgi:acetoin utilization deacetylase AcuC-like enzyme